MKKWCKHPSSAIKLVKKSGTTCCKIKEEIAKEQPQTTEDLRSLIKNRGSTWYYING